MRSSGNLVAIGVGGVVGASVRWSVGVAIEVDGFAWHTLIVNVVGCLLLGAITGRPVSTRTHRAVGVGFCGGLTTFSTFAIELVELLDAGDPATAIAYLLASLVFGYVAFVMAKWALTTAEPGR